MGRVDIASAVLGGLPRLLREVVWVFLLSAYRAPSLPALCHCVCEYLRLLYCFPTRDVVVWSQTVTLADAEVDEDLWSARGDVWARGNDALWESEGGIPRLDFWR